MTQSESILVIANIRSFVDRSVGADCARLRQRIQYLECMDHGVTGYLQETADRAMAETLQTLRAMLAEARGVTAADRRRNAERRAAERRVQG